MSSLSEIMKQIGRVIKNLKNKITWNTQVSLLLFKAHTQLAHKGKVVKRIWSFRNLNDLTAPLEPKAHGSKNWPKVPKENMLCWTGKWQMTCQGLFIHIGLIKPVSQENNTNRPWNLQLPPYREIANIMEDKERGPQWTHSPLKLNMWRQWSES